MTLLLTEPTADSLPRSSPTLVRRAPRWTRRALLRALSIPSAEAGFARRGFHLGGDASARVRLERIGEVFLAGYHAGLGSDAAGTAALLERVPLEERGFAFEGAAMGLALTALLLPWRWRHFQDFRHGAGERHCYMVHVGAGWALAALHLPPRMLLGRLDPLIAPLALDGVGFYRGYFAPRRHLVQHRRPKRLRGVFAHAFDQGLGRALWFAAGADVAAVAERVNGFPRARQSDVWSGVGLACAYAGGSSAADLRTLRASAGPAWPAVGQGACFAAGARQRAGNPAPHTDAACQALCGRSAAAAAALTEDARSDLPRASAAYATWRVRIQDRLREEETR
jgi:enediyne biosynthesis protein E3